MVEKVFARLDTAFKPDLMTELPDDFEAFFVKLERRSGQTLQEYQTEERRLRTSHQVELPEEVKAWRFLQRSGISTEQRQMVMTQIGTERLNLTAVERAMNFLLGQDSRDFGFALEDLGGTIMPKTKTDEQPSKTAYTGKADSHVPVFTNIQKDYREYRERAELYRKKMEFAGRQQEVVFNLVTLMTGRDWDPPAVALPTSRSRPTTCSGPRKARGKNPTCRTLHLECTGRKMRAMDRTTALPARLVAGRTAST